MRSKRNRPLGAASRGKLADHVGPARLDVLQLHIRADPPQEDGDELRDLLLAHPVGAGIALWVDTRYGDKVAQQLDDAGMFHARKGRLEPRNARNDTEAEDGETGKTRRREGKGKQDLLPVFPPSLFIFRVILCFPWSTMPLFQAGCWNHSTNFTMPCSIFVFGS